MFPLFLVTLEDEDSATSDFSAALVILITEKSEVINVRDLFFFGILELHPFRTNERDLKSLCNYVKKINNI